MLWTGIKIRPGCGIPVAIFTVLVNVLLLLSGFSLLEPHKAGVVCQTFHVLVIDGDKVHTRSSAVESETLACPVVVLQPNIQF